MSAERDEIRRQLGCGQGQRQNIGEMKFSVRRVPPATAENQQADDSYDGDPDLDFVFGWDPGD
jgi:hypothetical protein